MNDILSLHCRLLLLPEGVGVGLGLGLGVVVKLRDVRICGAAVPQLCPNRSNDPAERRCRRESTYAGDRAVKAHVGRPLNT